MTPNEHKAKLEQMKKLQDEIDASNIKEFQMLLQSKGLYQVVKLKLWDELGKINLPSLQLFCEDCNGERTYNYIEESSDIKYVSQRKSITSVTQGSQGKKISFLEKEVGNTYKLIYRCMSCRKHEYSFLVTFRKDGAEKTGQVPSFRTNIEKEISKKLGPDLSKHYKNGKVCESHGLGIAAMA